MFGIFAESIRQLQRTSKRTDLLAPTSAEPETVERSAPVVGSQEFLQTAAVPPVEPAVPTARADDDVPVVAIEVPSVGGPPKDVMGDEEPTPREPITHGLLAESEVPRELTVESRDEPAQGVPVQQAEPEALDEEPAPPRR